MKNNKAFTLVELIVTIVIITLILLVVFPSVYKISKDNDQKEYEYYYKVAKEAAYVYADTKKDSLGGSLGTGCISGITIRNLIDLGFLKPFNKEDVDYSGNAVIRNNYGKLTINLYMEIAGNNYGTEDTDTCLAYTPSGDTTLSDFLLAANASNTLNAKLDDNQYVVGENPNNYVWYSGKLWRAVQIDKKSEEVKLVTEDIISVIPFDNDTNGFKDSYMEAWLNNYFLNSLYSPKTYISTHTWETGVNKKVGLISEIDFNSSKDSNNTTYLNNGDTYRYWVTDESSNNEQKAVFSGEVYDFHIDEAFGVKPSIYIHAGIKVVEGNGTKADPYQLDGNKIQSISNKRLNTRYSGEYVEIGGILYRIISVIDNKTKLTSVRSLTIEDVENRKMTKPNYTLSKVYEYLNNSWYETFSIKNKIVLGDWCLANVNTVLNLTQCSDNRSFKIGLPRYGEIFTSDYIKEHENRNGTQGFWTLTPFDNQKMVGIYTSNRANLSITSPAGVKPSFYLDSTTTIKSGSGTETDPFVL